MEKCCGSMCTWLDGLRDGRKLQDVAGTVLQVLTGLAALWLIGIWWGRWSPPSGTLGFFGWVALVLWQLAWPVAMCLALQAFFRRASDIRRLPPGRYTVAPMVELMLRGVGEAVLCASMILAIPAMIAVWCNGFSLLLHLLPSFPSMAVVLPWYSEPRFWTGLLSLVALAAQGLLALVVAYFVAESLIALFAIAEDVHALRGSAGGQSVETAVE